MIAIDLPILPMGQHYSRVTFPMSWCRHDYDSPERVAVGMAGAAGLRVVAVRQEGTTMAVYALEPDMSDARGWGAYRALQCSSARRYL
jgi:hypothetical protein